jgi:hypothetical protein
VPRPNWSRKLPRWRMALLIVIGLAVIVALWLFGAALETYEKRLIQGSALSLGPVGAVGLVQIEG